MYLTELAVAKEMIRIEAKKMKQGFVTVISNRPRLSYFHFFCLANVLKNSISYLI